MAHHHVRHARRRPRHCRSESAPSALEAARALLGGRLHLVRRLLNKGLEMAEGCWRAAGGREADAFTPVALDWLSVTHAKVSRALRMAAFLRLRLLAILKLVERGDARRARRAMEKAGLTGPDWDDEGLDEALEAPKVDRLERLESLYNLDRMLDFGPDPQRRYVMSRPVPQLIAEICEGLGVGREWLAEAEAAWAARSPGEPAREARPVPDRSADSAPALPAPAPSPPKLNRRARRRMRAMSRQTSARPPRPP